MLTGRHPLFQPRAAFGLLCALAARGLGLMCVPSAVLDISLGPLGDASSLGIVFCPGWHRPVPRNRAVERMLTGRPPLFRPHEAP